MLQREQNPFSTYLTPPNFSQPTQINEMNPNFPNDLNVTFNEIIHTYSDYIFDINHLYLIGLNYFTLGT